MAKRLAQVLAVRATMLAAAEAGGVLATRRPSAAARLYGAWTLVTAFGFALGVLSWIVVGIGPGGRLLRLDPSGAPALYPPALRSPTRAGPSRALGGNPLTPAGPRLTRRSRWTP